MRQRATLDERRRRVLFEESAAKTTPRTPTRGHRPVYRRRAMRDGQPRLSDVIPARLWLAVLVMAAPLLLFSALVACDHLLRIGVLGAVWRPLLAFAAPASIARGIGGFWLLGAAVLAAAIYHVRRHRVDDYGGTFQIWPYVAIVWAGWGCLWTTPVLKTISVVGNELLPASLGEMGAFAATLTAAAGLVGLLTRLAFEMRTSSAALAWLAIAGLCACAGVAGAHPGINTQLNSTAATCLVAAAHGLPLAVLLSMLCYARAVLLAACLPQETVVVEQPAAGDESISTSETTAVEEEAATIKLPEPAARPAANAAAPCETPATEATPSEASGDGDQETLSLNDGKKRLTKAERKKQRKQNRRMAA